MNPGAPEPQASLPLDPPQRLRPAARLLLDLPRIGPVELQATRRGLSALHFVRGSARFPDPEVEFLIGADPVDERSSARVRAAARDHLQQAWEALEVYASGRPWKHEPQLDLTGVTAFRTRVYHRLLQIPFGGVVSYGELSRDLGRGLAASRAVGQAVGANPVGIFIPCHRVIRSDGTLGGFSGGLERKVELLEIEGRGVARPHPESPVGTDVLDLFSSHRPV